MKTDNLDLQKRLLLARDYRSFLKLFFEKGIPGHRPLSYGEFALRAGFRSKTFLNEVVRGRKRLTPMSISKVKTGLKLNRQWSEYFHCLVSIEEEDFRTQSQDAEFFDRRRDKLAKVISSRLQDRAVERSPEAAKVFLKPGFHDVFASLGSAGTGADLETLERRSKVDRRRLLALLDAMIAIGIVELRDERYVPTNQAFDLDDLGYNAYFKEHFFNASERAKRRFQSQADGKQSLFMTQTYSISKSNLAQLRAQLAELLREFAETTEHSEGDCVVELVASLTHN